MNYIDNIDFEMLKANKKAFHNLSYKSGATAWDNAKRKTQRTLMPRGKVVQRLKRLQTDKMWGEIKAMTCSLGDLSEQIMERKS